MRKRAYLLILFVKSRANNASILSIKNEENSTGAEIFGRQTALSWVIWYTRTACSLHDRALSLFWLGGCNVRESKVSSFLYFDKQQRNDVYPLDVSPLSRWKDRCGSIVWESDSRGNERMGFFYNGAAYPDGWENTAGAGSYDIQTVPCRVISA